MANPYTPPQASVMGYPQSQSQMQLQQNPTQFPPYSILGPSQYPESVAFWHTPSPVPPFVSSTQNQQRSLQPGTEHKKHRRTRSGCFTCRSRRIKCDETRPVCDRCRKGNRDCVYPSASGSTSRSSARSRSKSKGPSSRSQGTDSPGQVEQDESCALNPIADNEEDEERSPGSGPQLSPAMGTARSLPVLPKRQNSSQSPTKNYLQSFEHASSSPSTETSPRFETISIRSGSTGLPPQEPVGSPGTSNLAEDLRFYLIFHQEVLTYRHYLLRHPCHRFVHQTITELALQYEPLLYAAVGFAAYHHCVQSGNGNLCTFLKYYNKALTLLRESLSSGEKHTEAMLITVLVLTTFEELSGDWVNLISHHQAAHALMSELLTPQSINHNEMHSHIFLWYSRFDLVAGILAGNEAVLGRDWYISKEQYDGEQAALYPHDAQKQIDFAVSINRRFGLDMASLYAKLSRGIISIDDFIVQNQTLSQTLERMKNVLIGLENPEHTVQSFPNKKPLTEDDPFDPYIPGSLSTGPLWRVNFAWIDYLSTRTMFEYQSFLTLQQPSMPELERLALEQCRLIETIDRWPEKENGYFFAFNNCLGIASILLPKDEKHIMWCRRKLVKMEQNGCVTAPRYRTRMAELWQKPELNHWWLPNDEGYPDIVREVRALTEERTDNPQDDFRESVRDMKTLFWKITLDDSESDKSSPSTLASGT